MSADNREKDLFNSALERPPAEREAFLRGACHEDLDLLHRIGDLLRAFEESSKILADNGQIHKASSLSEKAGDRIGRYKLLQQIGEGGCGVVYMADQEEPVRRRVALKVIKLGMDTRHVVARFEAERQALALMDHPNIAKVFDGGSTESGRPFFVMELVRGVPITEYCDNNHLPTRDRLNLFIQVCQAVQHAHQKGVIHRDLKPSNILVTLNDGVPLPMVIDFGIAKAIHHKLTEKTFFTNFAQMIGTPAYMSPEQAEMSKLDVDTRTDIYSLGVLLYELLTGETPFPAKELLKMGVAEMQRIITEQEPIRPSTRFSTMTSEDRNAAARNRNSDAPALSKLFSGDLDWIVMKALEKDRARRYDTATSLAADVRRHLANEAVIARPPSNLYRMEKMVRRNKLACVAGGSVTMALLLGTAMSAWQAIRAINANRDKTSALETSMRAQASEAKVRIASEQRLYDLLVSEARAKRKEHLVGYRDEVFKLIKEASLLDVPQRDLTVLRTHAVSCMGDIAGYTPVTFTNFPPDVTIKETQIDPTSKVMGFLLSDGSILLRSLPLAAEIDHLNRAGNPPVSGYVFKPSGDQIISRHVPPLTTRELSRAETVLRFWNRQGDGRFHENKTLALPGTYSLLTSRKGVFAAVQDSQANLFKVVDFENSITLLEIPAPKDVRWIALSPDHTYFALASEATPGSSAFVIDVWDLKSRQVAGRLQPALEIINGLSFSPGGEHLACLSFNGCAVYSMNGFRPVDEVPERFFRDPHASSVSFLSNDTVIALPIEKRRIRLWDWTIKRDIAVLEDPQAATEAIFAPDNSVLVTSGERDIRVHRLSGMTEQLSSRNLLFGGDALAFSPESTRFASFGRDKSNVIIRDALTGQKIWETETAAGPFESRDFSGALAYGPGGLLAASSSSTRRISIWSERTRSKVLDLETNAPSFLGQAQFTTDGRYLVTLGSRDDKALNGGEIHIWGMQGNTSETGRALDFGTLVKKLELRGFYTFAIAPDNQQLACSIHRDTDSLPSIYITEIGSQASLRFLANYDHATASGQNFSFTPDSRHLLLVNSNRQIVTIDVETGVSSAPPFSPLSMKLAGAKPRLAFALAPDGTKLAITSSSGFGVDLWDWKDRKLLYSLPDKEGMMWQLTWSPDSSRLSVCHDQSGTTMWNLKEVDEVLAKLGIAP